MTDLRGLLQQIKDGKKSFGPASNSPEDMAVFQDIAKALAFANDEGLLEGFASHKESYTGNRWYVVVMVKSGLSYQGQQYLEQPAKPPAPAPGDIVQIKPNFYGISIDFNALWRRLRGRT
ncbi:hypothetical protein [Rhodanobacter soli]|jgi:hypothetical protein|uniref:Uncharacterized protein n=1 Tax=Rhodanobacter soli TaxID=590609 RepID=A0ABV2Q1E8_9GAMM